MTEKSDDEAFMAAALRLARRGLGRVWPNPAVGCVLVRGNRVVGRGWTQGGGRPHAETVALSVAGSAASGATAYVSLEPCSHFGKTPPCSEALIVAGVVRVVTATEDPDPRVQGKGHERLREAGIAVTEGVCRLAADDLNAGFFQRVRHGRPMVTLKLAMSVDGRIATHNGQSQWITDAESRARAHLLRAEHDAVMIGSATAIADNPRLTVRLPGVEGHPLRIVADGRLTLPLTHELVRTAREVPTWLLTRADADRTRQRAFEEVGVEVLTLKGIKAAPLDLGKALKLLGERGLTRVLVEGGGRLAASLLSADLVDRLVVFYAGMAIGGDGVPGIAGLGLHRLAGAPRFRRRSVERVGQDVMVQYSH
ncbi:MAG: bifunctional diaminohydroxyphosphoribosylaminopyrimidine deaminase/5-amino-6-(5-phosphoribosylamino)uracil reductase RibD [Rhodospirillales bacterium]|nr:bifunctional diaminohydroxyphosphoribosylaminopyrimidine deaminase/5-amino-6-(5-phosphoribosylamino)uracil reductase RibD [Rhodospirillales bacterium]